MKMTITDAAKLAGLSRSYFHMQFVKTGRISIERDDAGKPWVDSAELVRVFPGKLSNTQEHAATEHRITPPENTAMQAEIDFLRIQLQEARSRETWLQTQVEKLGETVRLLEHRSPQQAAPAPRRGFWSRVFGGAV